MPASNSRSPGLQGAKVTPQLPSNAVVTPCQLIGVKSGSQAIVHLSACTSTKPGVTTKPSASIVRLAAPRSEPTSVIKPSFTAISATLGQTCAINHHSGTNHQVVHCVSPVRRCSENTTALQVVLALGSKETGLATSLGSSAKGRDHTPISQD